jgi:alpha,alpha-trehalose phosphorylase
VEIDQDSATYSLLEGPSLTVRHHGDEVELTAKRPEKRALPKLETRDAPAQPHGRAPRRRVPKA